MIGNCNFALRKQVTIVYGFGRGFKKMERCGLIKYNEKKKYIFIRTSGSTQDVTRKSAHAELKERQL